MFIFAFLCLFLGIYPQPLYALLPFAVNYEPYTAAHLVAQFQLLLFAGLAFFVMLPLMKRTLTISLDFDWFYRYLFKTLSMSLIQQASRLGSQLESLSQQNFARLSDGLHRHYGPKGILSRTWPTGSMVLWIAILLGGFLLLDSLG